jgi:hypothetical protein
VTAAPRLLLLLLMLIGAGISLGVDVGPAANAPPRTAAGHARAPSLSFVVVLKPDAAPVDTVLQRLGVKPRFRYSSQAIHGFAARLSPRLLRRVVHDRAVASICPARWSWIVVYANVTDVDARTNELGQKYDFEARHRYVLPPGFAATLSPAQLHGLSEEPDIAFIEPDTFATFD